MSDEFWAGRRVAHRIKWRSPWHRRLHRAGVALGIIEVPVYRVSPFVEAFTLQLEASARDLERTLFLGARMYSQPGTKVQWTDARYAPQ